MTESIVLLFLGACWAGYLGWYWRENRRSTHQRRDGIRAFSSSLGTLGGSAHRSVTAGAGPASLASAPRTTTDAARRRRDVLFGLVVAAALSLFAAIGLGGIFVLAHVVIDIALVAFVYAMVQRRNEVAEREMKVHMLHPERAEPLPAERPLADRPLVDREAVGT